MSVMGSRGDHGSCHTLAASSASGSSTVFMCQTHSAAFC